VIIMAAAVGALHGVRGANGTDTVVFYAFARAGSWAGGALIGISALWTLLHRRVGGR
jgi:hypothetical protein